MHLILSDEHDIFPIFHSPILKRQYDIDNGLIRGLIRGLMSDMEVNDGKLSQLSIWWYRAMINLLMHGTICQNSYHMF